MVKSREYVLTRLDEWLLNRANARWSAVEDLVVFSRVFRRITENGDAQAMRGLLFSVGLKPKDVKNCVYWAGLDNYFTQGYATLEAFLEGAKVEGCTSKDFPEGIWNEYMMPALNAVQPCRKFVQNVRSLVADPSAVLSDDQIERSFREVFPDTESFKKVADAQYRAGCIMIDLLVSSGRISRQAVDDLRSSAAYVFSEALSPFYDKVFS